MLRQFWGQTSFKEALIWGAAISIFVFILVLQKPEPLEIAVKILIKTFFFSTLFMYALKNILWIIDSRISPKSMKYLYFEDLYIQKKRCLQQKKRDSEGEFIDANLAIINSNERKAIKTRKGKAGGVDCRHLSPDKRFTSPVARWGF